MYFKYLKYFLILTIIIFSCDDIERNNILDPKNPASERPQIITVEAFVNTCDTLPYLYNNFMLEALDQIENKYKNQILITEYHRLVNNSYPDGFDNTKNEILYTKYFDHFFELDSRATKGVPDVYINGTAARIQGASSTSAAFFRLEQALNDFLSGNAYFTIEPNIKRDDNEYIISAKIARLGSSDKENVLLKAIYTNRFDNNLHKRVVVDYLKSQEIQVISNGEIREVTLGEVPISQNESKIIFVITSDDELEVYQSIEVDLN